MGPWILQQVFWPIVSAAAGATGAVLVKHAWEKRLGPSNGVPHPLLADTLDARLIASSLALLPTHTTFLTPPNPHLDAVLGGLLRVSGKSNDWKYWSHGDGSPSGVLASYLIAKAGWPIDMVNRSKDDTWAEGDGFVRGMDVEKVRLGAKKHGWLVTPVFAPGGTEAPATAGAHVAGVVEMLELGVVLGEAFKLEPGDYFAIGKPGGSAGTDATGVPDVGVVLEVADGKSARNVITAEGCLTDRGEPCARWRTRIFYDDGRFSDRAGERRLLWVVRPT